MVHIQKAILLSEVSGMTYAREKRLVNEWLTLYHRGNLQWKNVRLGAHATAGEARMEMVTLPYADAVYIEDGEVYIVEAKIKADPRVISQLEFYIKRFPETPEFAQYKEAPVHGVLLVGHHNKNVADMAEEKGMNYVLFTPSWVTEYLWELEQKKERRGR